MAEEQVGRRTCYGLRKLVKEQGTSRQLPEIKTDGFTRLHKLQAYPPFYLALIDISGSYYPITKKRISHFSSGIDSIYYCISDVL
jgi:hypothetical protein